MPLRYRITLLIVVLLAVSIIGNTWFLVWLGKRAMLQRAQGDGVAIARLLTNGVAIAEHLPDIVNAQISRQMIAEAALAAQLIDVAQQRGLGDVEIDSRLAEVVSRTAVKRILALGRDGRIGVRGETEYEPAGAFAHDRPLADVFSGTAPGKRWAEAPSPLLLPGQTAPMQFAAVRAPHGDGLVIIGEDTAATRALRREIGPERNISAMVGDAGIEGIWIFGENRQLLARSTLGNAAPATTTAEERAIVAQVIHTAQAQSVNDGAVIRVTAPVLDDDGLPMGAALIRFSTAQVVETVRHTIFLSVGLTFMLLLVAVLAADRVGRRLSRPIVAIADAARSVRARRYDDRMLAPIARRRDEIGSLARDFTEMAHQVLAREEELDGLVHARTRELDQRNRELTQAIDTIQADLDAARALQHAILPQCFPAAQSFAGVAIMTAARHIGGDFYDFFMVDEDHLAVIIADVSGKGVPAALFMAVSHTILRAQAMATPQPADCVRRANEAICAQNPMFLFITVFYGLLNTRTGGFRYVNAGHPAPILLQPAARAVSPLPLTEGVALGVAEDLAYREGEVALSPGDTLVLYTDGVSEAMNEAGNEFTDARITTALEGELDAEVGAILGHLIRDVEGFVGTAPQSDDLTCVVLRFLGNPVKKGRETTSSEIVNAG